MTPTASRKVTSPISRCRAARRTSWAALSTPGFCPQADLAVGDGLGRQVEDAGDVAHRLALASSRSTELALGEHASPGSGSEPDPLQGQPLRHGVVDVVLSPGDAADRLHQHLRRRRLGDVTARAGSQRAAGEHHVLVHAGTPARVRWRSRATMRRVTSMPPMRGRLMSITTTRGRSSQNRR
jgi:hypothetical protein